MTRNADQAKALTAKRILEVRTPGQAAQGTPVRVRSKERVRSSATGDSRSWQSAGGGAGVRAAPSASTRPAAKRPRVVRPGGPGGSGSAPAPAPPRPEPAPAPLELGPVGLLAEVATQVTSLVGTEDYLECVSRVGELVRDIHEVPERGWAATIKFFKATVPLMPPGRYAEVQLLLSEALAVTVAAPPQPQPAVGSSDQRSRGLARAPGPLAQRPRSSGETRQLRARPPGGHRPAPGREPPAADRTLPPGPPPRLGEGPG